MDPPRNRVVAWIEIDSRSSAYCSYKAEHPDGQTLRAEFGNYRAALMDDGNGHLFIACVRCAELRPRRKVHPEIRISGFNEA